ncbi:MAG: PPC domain-containing protein, partial [Candidatus Sericytochromatia bacterium]|nr:PPC domain-containing protein [Candidatus Tanganyikabacteria bacterium]
MKDLDLEPPMNIDGHRSRPKEWQDGCRISSGRIAGFQRRVLKPLIHAGPEGCARRRKSGLFSVFACVHLGFLFFASALSIPLAAAPPVLQELLPRGGQRGKIFTLYLRGENLPPDAQIRSTLPASFSRLTLSKDPLSEAGSARPNSVLPFLVTLKPEAPTGFYPIRITSSEGISNVLLFSVGDLPEIEEAESRNPKLKDPQAIVVPAVVNGTLGAADIDTYVFQARAGQKLVFEVEARRMGSAIDPAIEITGPGGKELASNDDAPALGVDSRVEVAFARAGEYRVRVHDTKYSDQAQNFYRLKIGSY